MVDVIKKSSKTEAFSATKLEASLRKAGATAAQAKQIAQSVQKLAEGVTTAEIRQLAIAQLSSVNPSAQKAYQSYRKP